MTLYRVMDDEVITATGPVDLVEKLTATSFSPVENEQAFIDRAAMWANVLYGYTIRTESPEAFVEDMLFSGIYAIETPS